MSKPNSKKGHSEPKINVSDLIKKNRNLAKLIPKEPELPEEPDDESCILTNEQKEYYDSLSAHQNDLCSIAEHINRHYFEKKIRDEQERLPKEVQRKESTYLYESEFSNHELNFITDDRAEYLRPTIRYSRWEIISECGTRGLVEISTNKKSTFNSLTYTIDWYRKILVDKSHRFVE